MVDAVKFLRRRNSDDAVGAATSEDGSETITDALGRRHTAGKGRPTPKRREAETKRRGPAPPPPKTQREAQKLARQNRASRAERRQDAAGRRARMLAGDERALMPRDRGPVKAYVRDVVDSRRHLIGLFMPLAALVFVSLIVPVPRLQSMVSLFCMAMLAAIVLEGVLLGRRVTRAAREKFPKEQVSGVAIGWYSFSRASQLRKLRVPKPRVKIGAEV
ncbi:MAG: hypothetical protein QOC67_3072 [Pseudonocardiales bacterium]|jgi:hypothetical protein|nr:hypothetical protein [Pseudonocardia sp.]MDT7586473.1 hypothetical protein [Pseudonocardiales bacterium]MDT7598976.1 hypothetical protein [Pseudonocardiales bacterium]MDT7647310.1 hypothetical protein [Pseudonocardiales bacterium]MDT7656549.1 hypothetical protein [Pseudonocardiales bacterium]